MRTRQQEIIDQLNVKPNIDPTEEIEQRIHFLSSYLISADMRGFVLGISGGQDSLLAGILAARAAIHCRTLGYQATFHAVLLPYGQQADIDDAKLACDTIHTDILHTFNIKPAVDSFTESYNQIKDATLTDFNKGNAKARLRMTCQYALAAEHRLLVIGTDHAAESVNGFFTKFGDGAADILPLAGLTKRQGRAMLELLDVPEQLLTKTPTADLLDDKPGQSDESELGMSYHIIDDYLEGKDVSISAATIIEHRFDMSKHKRALPVQFTPLQQYESFENLTANTRDSGA